MAPISDDQRVLLPDHAASGRDDGPPAAAVVAADPCTAAAHSDVTTADHAAPRLVHGPHFPGRSTVAAQARVGASADEPSNGAGGGGSEDGPDFDDRFRRLLRARCPRVPSQAVVAACRGCGVVVCAPGADPGLAWVEAHLQICLRRPQPDQTEAPQAPPRDDALPGRDAPRARLHGQGLPAGREVPSRHAEAAAPGQGVEREHVRRTCDRG